MWELPGCLHLAHSQTQISHMPASAKPLCWERKRDREILCWSTIPPILGITKVELRSKFRSPAWRSGAYIWSHCLVLPTLRINRKREKQPQDSNTRALIWETNALCLNQNTKCPNQIHFNLCVSLQYPQKEKAVISTRKQKQEWINKTHQLPLKTGGYQPRFPLLASEGIHIANRLMSKFDVHNQKTVTCYCISC